MPDAFQATGRGYAGRWARVKAAVVAAVARPSGEGRRGRRGPNSQGRASPVWTFRPDHPTWRSRTAIMAA